MEYTILFIGILFIGMALGVNIQKAIEKNKRKRDDDNRSITHIIITNNNEWLLAVKANTALELNSYIQDCRFSLHADRKSDRKIIVYEVKNRVV